MEEIKFRKMCSANPNDFTVAYWFDSEEVAKKVNEIVRFLNAHRTLADMPPEKIEKIGKFIQELEKREWKIEKKEVNKDVVED